MSVRVAPVNLKGILAQIVYVDLVDRTEEEAIDLLLKRVSKKRGKPSTPPKFPGGDSRAPNSQREVAVRPVYPAAAEDILRLRSARDAIIRWRGKYADKIEALRTAGELARKWSKEAPLSSGQHVVDVIDLAATVGRDLRNLPISKLEFADPYGLAVHGSVFSGYAIDDVIRQRSYLGSGTQLLYDAYGFELIARVLEAALSLVRFNIEALPRGYLAGSRKDVPGDLSRYQSLLIAKIDDDPSLNLIAVDGEVQRIGSFAARKLELQPLCARRNQEGSMDLVAQDVQHLYYWQKSSQLPTMQFPLSDRILDARFLKPVPTIPVATVSTRGTTKVITAEGKCTTICDGIEDLQDSRIWLDPLDSDAWYVVSLTQDWRVTSGLHGTASVQKEEAELWDGAVFREAFDGLWNNVAHMTLAILDGLPCLIISRQALGREGEGVCFLDPRTLLPIRHPLFIREFVGELIIAGSRWLVAGLLQDRGNLRDRIVVYDLDSEVDLPVGAWFERNGDLFDITVTAQSKESFRTMQVYHSLDESFFELCQFDLPSGTLALLERFSNLRIWPVEIV